MSSKARGRVRIRDTDRGFARLMRQLRGRFAQRLAVGVFERSWSTKQRGSKGVPVMVVALAHEFGTSTVPERSFIRAWADESQSKNLDRIRRVARAVISRTGFEERLLRGIGKEMVEEIRERISRGMSPALTPESAERKGSDTPLEGGQLMKAIRSEVRGVSGK